MYSLAGFIQLLLILSHSDYLPDLSAVWNQEREPLITAPVQTADLALLVPTTFAKKNHTDAVHISDKWMLTPVTQSNGWLLRNPFNTIPAGRVISSDKLYLIFCRLKIGG